MRRSPIGLVVVLVAVPAATIAGPWAGAAATAPFKAAMMPLAAGSYGQACVRFEGEKSFAPNSGAPITISADGTISWGKVHLDIVHTPSTRFLLSVGHEPDNRAAGAGFDLTSADGSGRSHVIAVNILADASALAATATDETVQPSQGTGCSSTTFPRVFGADLWQLASQFIHVEGMDLDCIGMMDFKRSRRSFTFTDKLILLGDARIAAGGARASEDLQVNDFGSNTFAYELFTTDKESVMVAIHADKSLDSVGWSPVGGGRIACTPPKKRG
jgi:hypothetical protein